MATQTTRIVTRNHVVSASLRNAPAEDPLFPAVNVLNLDRYLPHGCPGTGGNVDYDVDLLSSSRTTHIVGLLGLVNNYIVTQPTQFYATAGAVYPPDGSWIAPVPLQTLAGAVGSGDVTARDVYYILSSPIVLRYWRLTLTFNNSGPGYSLGSLLIGQMDDLGIAYSGGSTRRTILQRVRQRTVHGQPSVTTTGRPRDRRSLVFNSIQAATVAKLDAFVLGSPGVIIDPFGKLLHCDMAEDSLQVEHVAGSAASDLFNATLEVETLP